MFTLRLLGGAQLDGENGPVTGRAAHRRRIALLALLSAPRQRAVLRDRILLLLWPEASSSAGRHLLSESLSVLRRELGEDAFVCVGDDLRLADGVLCCDLARFHEAVERGDDRAVVALYAGPFMDGFSVADAPDFERWVEEERNRAARAYAAAVERLAVASGEAGDAAGAVEWWRRLAVHDPYSSRVALCLLRALDAAGERAAGVRHAAVHAALVRAELGMEPDQELLAFAEQLRGPEPRPAYAAAGASRSPVIDGEVHADLAVPDGTGDETTHAPAGPAPGPDGAARRTAAVLVAALTVEARGATGAGERAAERFRGLAAREVGRFGGTLVEFLGGGALAEFAVPDAAARAALRLQRRVNQLSGGALRGGIHFGEVATTGDGGYYGEAVTAATRLQEEAEPGVVLVTADFQDALARRGRFRLVPRGARTLPGAPLPTTIFELREIRTVVHPTSEVGENVATSRLASPSPRWLRWGAVAAAGAALLAAALVIAGRAGDDVGASTRAGARLDPNVIAVLPFEDLSPDRTLGYLAAGLGEAVMGELSAVQGLEVVSRTGVQHYAGAGLAADSMARALGAGSLVEASVAREADTVRVVVRLVDGVSARVLDTDEVRAPQESVFRLEAEVGRLLARFLRRRLGVEVMQQQGAVRARDEAAYELLLRGRQARADAARLHASGDTFDLPSARRALVRADSFLTAATARDPRWEEPLVERGWVRFDAAGRAGGAAEVALTDSAVVMADQALALRGDSPGALELRGTAHFRLAMLARDRTAAERHASAAEQDLRRTNTATGHSRLSQLLRILGEYAESVIEAERAHAADAYLVSEADIVDRRFRSELLLGHFPSAREHCAAGRRDYPGDLRFRECEMNLLARDWTVPADPVRARRLVAELDSIDPLPAARAAGRAIVPLFRQALLAAVLARAGENDSARAVLARARDEARSDREASLALLYDEAWVWRLLGDTARSADAIDRYLEARPVAERHVRRDPVFRAPLPAATGR
jgi:DNA-binding SARP family transcriptional activator/TolB-like protein/class 3 adenylate cyclase